MRVLLTNHSLLAVGGTEKWTYAMATELQRRGHDVEVFTFLRGFSSEHFEKNGIPVVDKADTKYDLCLINHNTCLAVVQGVSGPKVFTAHGPLHPLEIPAKGADVYVSVSPEVRACNAMLSVQSTVITNGVDLSEFAPRKNVRSKPVVLSMCKRRQARAMVCAAAMNQGLEVDYTDYMGSPCWDMASRIKDADIVVACGRSAYEALACGKQVIVFDARGKDGPMADGLITPDNIEKLRQTNCSTRCCRMYWTVEDIEAALYAYKYDEWGRGWAEKNANISDKVDQYLDLVGVH